MANIFKRTLLWKQVEEACAEYAALRRREYRHALKTKRMFIRLQVMAEVQRSQIGKAITQLAAVESAARVAAVRAAAQANIKRRQAVESYAAKIGAKLPAEKGLKETEDFKRKMMARFKNSIPDSARGQSAGLIVDSVLEDSFNKVRLDPKAGPAKMNVDLAVSLAKQADISPDELDEMLTAIEDPTNKDVSQYLRENILPRLRERDGAGTRGLADALPTRKFPKMNLDTQTSSTAC